MGIEFVQKFGNKANNSNTQSNADKPKAQFWLNVGYVADYQVDGEDHQKFISLAQGIPLDTIEPLPTNSSNVEFAAMQAARNDLLEQILAHAETLKPGEETALNLTIHLRRVKDEAPTIDAADNPLIRKLTF